LKNRSPFLEEFIQVYIFRLVIETLKEVDDDRRCFRLVGGVLVERTVKDVLPALVNNKEQVNVPKICSYY